VSYLGTGKRIESLHRSPRRSARRGRWVWVASDGDDKSEWSSLDGKQYRRRHCVEKWIPAKPKRKARHA